MKVTYLAGASRIEVEALRDQIKVLILSEEAVLEAVDPRAPSILMRGPQISIIPANQSHPGYRLRQSDALVVALDPAFYEAKVRAALGCAAPRIVEPCTVTDPLVREIGNALRAEFRMQRIPSTVYLECWAGVIAIHLASTYGRRRERQQFCSGLRQPKLGRVLAFINGHLGDAMLVAQLAAMVHMSPYHFTRMFKQAAGRSPHVYITMQRMERAKELLCNTDLPLTEVGALAGFQTQAHFTEVFRKRVGMTPRIFRLNSPAPLWRANRAGPPASTLVA
jgi:AraC family transcriptional regulator